jgi:sugar lactone lactonase YvrE
MTRMPKLVLDARAQLAEGPCWDPNKKALYWVDIEGRALHRYHPASQEHLTVLVEQRIGAAVPREGTDEVVAALEDGFYLLHVHTGELIPLSLPEPQSTTRFNDGKCDAAGRFWAGTMGYERHHSLGSLYCLAVNGTVRRVLSDVNLSNGLGWSPDGRSMYYIDSPTKQVAVYDFEPETGAMRNARVAVVIPEGEGVPDGMAVDEEGMLWVAQWGGSCVSRWNPHTGERLEKIILPAEQVTSCTFGGEGWTELYITTARIGLTERQLQAQPHAGGIFKVSLDIKGLPTQLFRG